MQYIDIKELKNIPIYSQIEKAMALLIKNMHNTPTRVYMSIGAMYKMGEELGKPTGTIVTKIGTMFGQLDVILTAEPGLSFRLEKHVDKKYETISY